MSIRLLQRVLRNGTRLLLGDKRYIYQFRSVKTAVYQEKQPKTLQKAFTLAESNGLKNQQQSFFRFRRLLVDNILNRVTSPQSSTLRAEATKKFTFGDSLPFLSLVGCSLASGNGVLTKEDELEGICWEIREAVSKYQSKLEDKVVEKDVGDIKLSDLDIGPPISKGCNAVVYAAALKNQQQVDPVSSGKFKPQRHDTHIENTNEELNFFSPARSLPNFIQNLGGSVDNINQYLNEPSTSRVENSQRVVKFNESVKIHARSHLSSSSESSDEAADVSSQDATSIYQYPWALKMMFNYDIQSNAMSILRAMYKETVPARCRVENQDVQNWEKSLMEQTVSVPAHPNLVLMPAFFCDYIPKLRNSLALYPNALPQRLNPSTGYGRNMSLFLLMKRYNLTLREYLEENELDVRTKVILFAQLLEAVAHINHFQVAHRDLKSDNILIDMMTDSLPILVLTDFGCCLADKKHGLRVPYTSMEIDKGGNQALMAPEIITKTPSLFSVLNYTKSDLWACGTIAYEIFGYQNPFYYVPSEYQQHYAVLKSSDYVESMLPQMHDEVPLVVRKLIENILQRSPSKRLSTDVAANVLELYLWAPSSWIKFGRNPTNNEILEWLLSLTTKVLCERGLGSINAEFMAKSRRTYTEYVLISTFLSRANLHSIRRALNWIQSVQE